jgi:hypothetical protein
MNPRNIVDGILEGEGYARKLAMSSFATRQFAKKVAKVLGDTLFKQISILRIVPIERDPGAYYYGKPFRAVYRVEIKPEVLDELSRDIRQLYTLANDQFGPQHIRDWVQNRFATTLPAVLMNQPWIIYGEWSMDWDEGEAWSGTLSIELRVPPTVKVL